MPDPKDELAQRRGAYTPPWMHGGDETRTQETADPPSRSDARGDEALSPCIEILLHADVRRIGQYVTLDRASRDPVEIGRSEPSFYGCGASARALLDPCISRRQLSVRWLEGEGAFSIRQFEGSRRPVTLIGVDGRPRGRAEGIARPGEMLAIGDRVVLALGMRRMDEPIAQELVGTSTAMTALRARIDALAAADETVLVTGETGTGKELVARSLHARSPRGTRPFVPLNCAALPDHLLESELFGHERGAFTGAVERRAGLFRAAERGTLFLDEIGELSPAAQAKLLRVMQERAVRTVGGEREHGVDVRLIAATNRSLSQAVDEGRFRLDLLTRLDGLTIHVPPLRERKADILPLFMMFLMRALAARGVTDPSWLVRDVSVYPPPLPFDFCAALLRHEWPGNVRQLERVAIAAATLSLAAGRFMGPALEAPPEPSLARKPVTGARPTREELIQALESHAFVQQRAARSLGIPQATFARWLREEGVPRPNELERDQIEAALERAGGEFRKAAALLRVSTRGLSLRMSELGLRPKSR